MSNDEHSKISPSGFPRVILCPGSVNEGDYAPIQPPSIYAERGTLQHDAVVKRWAGKSIAGLKLEEEEVNNVDDAIDYLRELIESKSSEDFMPQVEMEVRGDLSHMDYPDIWGTRDVDLRFFEINGGVGQLSELHVIDWKFGAGVAVEVDDNPQLLGYLLMALTGTVEHNANKFFIHVVQPPKNYYACQQVSHRQIGEFKDTIVAAIEAANGPNPELVPGEKQCQFCKAAMTCRARHNHQNLQAGLVFEHLKKKQLKPHTVTTDENAMVYTMLAELIKYHAELGKHGFAELSQGRKFPGYKLVRGRSTRAWASEAGAQRWLMKYGSFQKPELFAPAKMISPAQAEKKNRGLKKDSDFKQLINKPPGSTKMVPDDDKREEVTPNDAAKDAFAGM